MAAVKVRIAAALTALGALAVPATVRAQAPAVEPEATRLLKRMTDYVGSLQRFSLDTESMFDDVLVSGQKIQYGFSSTLVVQRPNRMRADRSGDLIRQPIGGVEYYQCGGNYYRAAFQGNQVVYVTTQP